MDFVSPFHYMALLSTLPPKRVPSSGRHHSSAIVSHLESIAKGDELSTVPAGATFKWLIIFPSIERTLTTPLGVVQETSFCPGDLQATPRIAHTVSTNHTSM
ncbi:hypothetical protein GJ744_000305 [Endocarpon pusillum]|uniref:Uncharacterized protein n=1 Tax=Endocarpon pusillum TaxID=364733 RepID=A0A8H7AP72_9EURO|nr:hypothetical protein GJ744_000305 [Endocarpon pusillum]